MFCYFIVGDMKKIILLLSIFSLGLLNTVIAQEGAVKWYTFEEAVALNKKEPRKIFIDVYTDWCGWCKKMDETTFSKPEIAKILNKDYYAVKFDAESLDTINFAGTRFVNEGGRDI